MRSSHNTITMDSISEFLTSKGIQPHSFSFFLIAFIKSEEKKGKSLRIQLSRVLVAQAELIQYHLDRGR